MQPIILDEKKLTEPSAGLREKNTLLFCSLAVTLAEGFADSQQQVTNPHSLWLSSVGVIFATW